jgi:hypothetical protein
MVRFQLNGCSLNVRLEPLAGELAAADGHLAWRLYLALVTRVALRDEQMPQAAMAALVDDLRAMLEDWPAARIDRPRPEHLGFVVVTIIETILLPCISQGQGASPGWRATRDFCQAFARDLAHTYGLPDAGTNIPTDLIEAWQARP